VPLVEKSADGSSQQIRFHKYKDPIPVSYKSVLEVIPKLWSVEERIDFMVHLGMGASRGHVYSVERKGRRDGYMMRDVDDEMPEKEWWPWDTSPPNQLSTKVDVVDVVRRLKGAAVPVSLGTPPLVLSYVASYRPRHELGQQGAVL
jgi:hypothetical protein